MKKILALFLLSSIVISIEAADHVQQADQQARTALDFYQKAIALFQQSQYEPSLAAVEEALRRDPKLVPALTLKARLAMTANRFDVARNCLRQAVEIEPRSAENQFLFGFALYVDNDFARALPALEQAARLKPGDARTEFYLALTYDGLGLAREAIGKYERVLQLAKEDVDLTADALVAYARLLFALGRFDESERLIDRALDIDGNMREARYEKGRLRLERRDANGAIEHGKRARESKGVGAPERQS